MNRDKIIKEDMKVLIDKGFFDLKSGQVIINKHNGVIQNIKFVTTPYEREKDLTKKMKRL